MYWFRQAINFWKLAHDEADEGMHSDYRSEYRTVYHTGSLRNLRSLIGAYGKQPWFEWSEMDYLFKQRCLPQMLRGNYLTGAYVRHIDELLEIVTLAPEYAKRWLNDFSEKYFEEKYKNKDPLTISELSKVENLGNLVNKNIQEKTKDIMIVQLNKIYNEFLQNLELLDDPEAEKRNVRIVKGLAMLYGTSDWFSDAAQEILKKMGPNIYSGALANTLAHKSIQNTLSHSVITEYDIAFFFPHSAGSKFLVGNELREFIAKATPTAKEYMRGFLYSTIRNHSVYFILDEDMQPMTSDYKTDPDLLSRGVYIWRLDAVNDGVKQIWGPIFADFEIVTQ